METDVVVVGTGGAALTAAILARDQGADVLVVERSDKVGGTTAVSGGVLWIPLNHHMKAPGVTDSRAEALTYCKRLAAGRAADDLVETFVDVGHQMVRYLEEHSAARFNVWPTPDDYGELAGGKANGRSLEPELFSTKGLGEWADTLRPAPMFTLPLTMTEAYVLITTPEKFSMDLLRQRTEDGMVGCGRALIGWLLKACLDRGVGIVLQTRARQLIREGERVVGLRAEQGGEDVLIRARRGVILACGGYEWNEALTKQFLPGPITHPLSPPFNQGDGLLMAMEIGADLANMDEALWIPAGTVPGETYEGRQLTRFIASE
jgi:succinate dehydrogenase/fumarate reductase flavoprotein subunit